MFSVKQVVRKSIKNIPGAYRLLFGLLVCQENKNIKYRIDVKKLMNETELRRKISQQ